MAVLRRMAARWSGQREGAAKRLARRAPAAPSEAARWLAARLRWIATVARWIAAQRRRAGIDPTLPATAHVVAVQQPSASLPERPYDLVLLACVLALLGIGTIEIY